MKQNQGSNNCMLELGDVFLIIISGSKEVKERYREKDHQ